MANDIPHLIDGDHFWLFHIRIPHYCPCKLLYDLYFYETVSMYNEVHSPMVGSNSFPKVLAETTHPGPAMWWEESRDRRLNIHTHNNNMSTAYVNHSVYLCAHVYPISRTKLTDSLFFRTASQPKKKT